MKTLTLDECHEDSAGIRDRSFWFLGESWRPAAWICAWGNHGASRNIGRRTAGELQDSPKGKLFLVVFSNRIQQCVLGWACCSRRSTKLWKSSKRPLRSQRSTQMWRPMQSCSSLQTSDLKRLQHKRPGLHMWLITLAFFQLVKLLCLPDTTRSVATGQRKGKDPQGCEKPKRWKQESCQKARQWKERQAGQAQVKSCPESSQV